MDNYNYDKFGYFIFDIVKDFYNNYLLDNSKIKNNEWTIISSIILQNENKYFFLNSFFLY